MLKKVVLHSVATALASIVFPVPEEKGNRKEKNSRKEKTQEKIIFNLISI